MAELKHVSDANFEQEVKQAELPVLVDFWAPWCGPCKMIAPVLEKLAEKFDGRLKVCKLNTDESPTTPGQLGIQGIPTLIIFKQGKEVERLVGFMPEPQLVEKIEPHLG
ncbi:MAG: thioredoxin [bacterium]